MNALPSTAELAQKKELNLYNKAWVDSKQATKVGRMLVTNSSLTFVGFRDCKAVGDAGAAQIARGIAEGGNASLKKLIFENTTVGDAGAIALAAVLPTSGLARVDFGYCQVGDDGANALAAAIAQNPPELTVLVLDHCKRVSDIGALALVDAIAFNTNLRTCGLKGTTVTSAVRATIEALLKPAAIDSRLNGEIAQADAADVGAGGEGGEVDHHSAMVKLYSKVDPSKLSGLASTLAKYAGKEVMMWRVLKKKYGEDAQPPVGFQL